MVDEKRLNKLKALQKRLVKRGQLLLTSIIANHERDYELAKDVRDLGSAAGINIFIQSSNRERMDEFFKLIEKGYKGGITYGPGDNSKPAIKLNEQIKQNVEAFTTKLGDDIKTAALDLVDKGMKEGLSTTEIRDQLMVELNLTKNRAAAISRTEIQRTSNVGAYIQAKENDASYFVVDNRAEACEECQDTYEGEVFSIDEIDALPPLHPNCACVPVFFNDETEAQNWASSIQSEDIQVREDIVEETGKPIPTDGTGNVSNN